MTGVRHPAGLCAALVNLTVPFCDTGFKRVANECVALTVPANAHVTGNQWFCDTGFKRVAKECVALTSTAWPNCSVIRKG